MKASRFPVIFLEGVMSMKFIVRFLLCAKLHNPYDKNVFLALFS